VTGYICPAQSEISETNTRYAENEASVRKPPTQSWQAKQPDYHVIVRQSSSASDFSFEVGIKKLGFRPAFGLQSLYRCVAEGRRRPSEGPDA
jgi:hypothetical protein